MGSAAALASFGLWQQWRLICGERFVAQRLRADCRHLSPTQESAWLRAEAGQNRLAECREVIGNDRFARRDRSRRVAPADASVIAKA